MKLGTVFWCRINFIGVEEAHSTDRNHASLTGSGFVHEYGLSSTFDTMKMTGSAYAPKERTETNKKCTDCCGMGYGGMDDGTDIGLVLDKKRLMV